MASISVPAEKIVHLIELIQSEECMWDMLSTSSYTQPSQTIDVTTPPPSQPGNAEERILPLSDGSTMKRRKTTGTKPTEDRDELVSVIKDVVDMIYTKSSPNAKLSEAIYILLANCITA